MKVIKTIFVFLLIVSTGYGVYYYRDQIPDLVKKASIAIGLPGPCDVPIKYSLGSYDARFKISQSQFKDIVSKASEVWNKAANKKLFVYDDKGSVLINLVYDFRQSTTQKLQSIDSKLKTGQEMYDSFTAKYNMLLATYNREKDELTSMISSYEASKKTYDDQVKYWNDQGGAPKAQYQILEKRRLELNDSAQAINEKQASLNSQVKDINNLAHEINLIAMDLKNGVKTYNDVGATTGEEFNEGQYIEDEVGKRINIYQFDNQWKLQRVLEHEFGHALGLSHVDYDEAIMYKLNTGTSLDLSASDTNELYQFCNIKAQ